MVQRPERFLLFLSHATVDRELALRIAKILDSMSLPTFVYESYQVGGQNRFLVIRDRIAESPYFVLLLTRKARKSEWVNQEIGYAVALQKDIIPIVETSPVRRRRIPYFGFVELNDPLDVELQHPDPAISQLLFTMMHYAKRDHRWRGMMRLDCRCGWSGRRGTHSLSQWRWDCPRCRSKIEVSPVSFEPLPQVD